MLPSLEDAASGDELRQAVHRVSAAEQAAKAQRVRLHNVLDPIFREWITEIDGVEHAAFQRKLPSQRGLPGWQPEDIRHEEVVVVGARGLGPLVEEYLDNEDAEELNEQLDLIRVHLDELERIRPDQPLARFEDQLSDYIRRFAPDTGVVRVPEGELVAASHLMEDMQLRLTKLFPDADVPGKPAPELVRS